MTAHTILYNARGKKGPGDTCIGRAREVRIIWNRTFSTLMFKSSSPAAGPMSSGARTSADRFAGGAVLDSGAGRLVAIYQNLSTPDRSTCVMGVA